MRARWMFVVVGFVGWAVAGPRAAEPAPGAPGTEVASNRRVAGRVLHVGRPRDARVELWPTAKDPDTGKHGAWLWSHVAWLLPRPAEPLGVVNASADAGFAFEGLAEGSYILVASNGDGLGGEAFATATLAGREDVHLETRTATLAGRVIGTDGRPRSVLVLARPVRGRHDVQPSWGPGPVATDADGRFVLRALPKGKVQVAALDEAGLRVPPFTVRVPRDEPLVLTGDAEAVEVTGRVVRADDGAPIAGAEVLPMRWGLSWPASLVPRARSDADGRFRLRVVPRSWGVAARLAGFVPGPEEQAGPDVTLRLTPEARLRGRLTAEDGDAPVAGVTVKALADDRDLTRLYPRALEFTAVTDAQGCYEIVGLDAGAYAVFALGNGWVSSNFFPSEDVRPEPYPLTLRAGEERVHDLTLRASGRITGVLRDHLGRPIVGAWVHAGRPSALIHGGSEGIPWNAYWDYTGRHFTDAEGRFELSALVPGTPYDVEAVPEDAALPAPHRIVPAQGVPTEVVLTSPAPRWVRVTLVEAGTDAPIRDADVSLLEAEAPAVGRPPGEPEPIAQGLRDVAKGRTDENGRVRLGPAGLGKLSVSAQPEGYVEDHRARYLGPETGPDGDLVAVVRLVRGRNVSGRVLLPDGSPAVGASVMLRPDEARASWGRGATTDAAGRFEHDSVGPSPHRLDVTYSQDGEFAGTAPVPADGAPVEIRLQRGPGPRRVVVRVLDPEGRPVPSAKASFATRSDGIAGGHVRAGRVEFEDRDAGEPRSGTVTIEEARGEDGRPLPYGRTSRVDVKDGDVVEIRMEPELAITGRVLGPSGKGVPGALVRADPVERGVGDTWRTAPYIWRLSDVARTNADGAFRIGWLGPGNHRVFVLSPPTHASPEPTDVDAGTQGLDLVARPTAPVTLRILDPDGKPVAGAQVVLALHQRDPHDLTLANLFCDGSPGETVTTDVHGRATFRGLDRLRPYVLGVMPPVTHPEVAEHVDVGWKPAHRVLTLERGHRVAGTVRDEARAPQRGVMVSCERRNGLDTRVTTDESGTFHFDHLRPGTVTIEAIDWHSERPRPRVRERIEVGRTEVVLVLRR